MQRVAIPRAAIVEEARKWLDVPYLHQGRSRGGVDCVGLCWVVYSRIANVTPSPDSPDYPYWFTYERKPNPARLRRMMLEFFDEIPKEDAKIGDILYIRFLREPTHLGILTDYQGQRGIIHAFSHVERVCEHVLDEKWWKTMVVNAFRLRGLD